MTTAIRTTIQQQLRKRWVRGMACLGLMLVAYVASAVNVSGLASPRFLGTCIEAGRWAIVRELYNASSSDWVGPQLSLDIRRWADYLSPLIIETRSYDGEEAGSEVALSEPQLKLEASHSSRLGGNLALPEDANWLPSSVLLAPLEIADLPPKERDEMSRQHFPIRSIQLEPFIFTSYVTVTR